MRIRPLYHTAADDIATLLQRAISYGVAPYVVPTGTTTGTGTTPGALARPAASCAPPAVPAASRRAPGGAGPGGRTTGGGFPGRDYDRRDHHRRNDDRRDHDRRVRGDRRRRHHQEHHAPDHRSENGQGHPQSGVLEDVFILSDENSNSLLILAPEKTQAC